MSLIDKLLQIDINKLEKQAKKYEVKRLSEAIGEPFEITIKPLTMEQVNHIGEIAKNGNERELAIVEACKIEGKKFTEQELLNRFKCPSAAEFVGKLLQPGEIQAIYNIINELSGYRIGVVEEIKN
ncbi:MAG TPA: hypothetical protein DCR77_06660 [Flavobacteriaceae bacterium]|nr:hypothetical protein [Flavobacteriaceae bacterium]